MSVKCPVSKSEFTAAAAPLAVDLPNGKLYAEPKEFQTGSVGWYACGKVPVQVGGKVVMAQVNITMTVIGSKEAAR